MTAMMIEEVETVDETKELSLLVQVPKPSDLMRLAFGNGWSLRHGIYGTARGSMGCAVGALRHGMILAEIGSISSMSHLDGHAIYAVIGQTFPAMLEPQVICEDSRHVCACGCNARSTVLMALEHGYESHDWDQAQCIEFLTKQGL